MSYCKTKISFENDYFMSFFDGLNVILITLFQSFVCRKIMHVHAPIYQLSITKGT